MFFFLLLFPIKTNIFFFPLQEFVCLIKLMSPLQFWAAGDQVKQPFVGAADKWLQSFKKKKKKKGLFWTSSAAPTDAACPRVPSPLPEISGRELGEAIYNLT